MEKISEKLLAEIKKCSSVEEINELLKSNNLNLTAQDLYKELNKAEGELSDDDLSNVTGGSSVVGLLSELIASYGKGAIKSLFAGIFDKEGDK